MSKIRPMGFWFLRHGETDWNSRNLAQGNVETRLNDKGLAQAKKAAEALKDRGITCILTSPLTRARETAAIIGDALDLVPVIEPELRETSYGVQEGFVMAEWFDEWVAGKSTPQGAETFHELTKRAVRAVNHCLAHEPPVLIVSHGAFFRAIRGAMGLDRTVRTANATPFWCDCTETGWILAPVKVH